MTYDLTFFAPTGKNIAAGALREYFRVRPHYEINGEQAIYRNEDTGVYFSFDVGQHEPDDIGDKALLPVATFDLNYFRPHIFGLEAEPEVAAFIAAFDLGIEDPQISGMANGPYSREGFLRGWNKGNEFGYMPDRTKHGRSRAHYTLPGETIERYWRWNYGRAALDESLGPSVFVPRIMFFLYARRLASAVAWTDTMPIALPLVDLYIIAREELAPRRFFSTGIDIDFATPSQVESLLAEYPLQGGPLPFRLLRYSHSPTHIVDWVRRLRGGKPKPEMVPVDQILDAEILDKFAGA